MATQTGQPGPVDVPVYPLVSLSAEAPPFVPLGADCWQLGSDSEKQFSRCAAKLRALKTDSAQLKEELNMLFDQLLSENYNRPFEPSVSIRPEVTKTLARLSSPTENNLVENHGNSHPTRSQTNLSTGVTWKLPLRHKTESRLVAPPAAYFWKIEM